MSQLLADPTPFTRRRLRIRRWYLGQSCHCWYPVRPCPQRGGSPHASYFRVSLFFFILKSFSDFLCFSWSWHFWRIQTIYFRLSLSLGLLMFPQDYFKLSILTIIFHKWWCVSLNTSHQETPSVTLSHVVFDHLDKVVFARFLHHEVTIFPFIISKYLGKDTLRQYKSPTTQQEDWI
jgi:hypothetical protein